MPIRAIVADLGAVFHWQPSETLRMTCRDALWYRRAAIRHAKAIRGSIRRR